MKIEDGIYRLRVVWVNAKGETMVHYDRQLCENYTDLKHWKESTKDMIEGYGGVVTNMTTELCRGVESHEYLRS